MNGQYWLHAKKKKKKGKKEKRKESFIVCVCGGGRVLDIAMQGHRFQ